MARGPPAKKVAEGRGEAMDWKKQIVERTPLPWIFSSGHDHIDRYTFLITKCH